MRVYRANASLGCILGAIIFLMVLYVFGWLVFTTPVGLALLATGVVWYIYRQWRLSRFGSKSGVQTNETWTEKDAKNPFEKAEKPFDKQQVVDVTQYEEVKDDNSK